METNVTCIYRGIIAQSFNESYIPDIESSFIFNKNNYLHEGRLGAGAHTHADDGEGVLLRRQDGFRHILLATFRTHSGNIQGTFRQHSGNIQGTFRES
jgi:hypothetical protein